MKIKYKMKEMYRPAGEPHRAEHGLHNITGAGLEEETGESPTENPDLNDDGEYSGAELKKHFDLNSDGKVTPDEYKKHVQWHEKHPEVFDYDKEELTEKKKKKKKDRCYRLAKQKYDVFPSAYASGFIVRCRKGKVAKKKK